MSFKDKQTINVLNYNSNPVIVSTRDNSYVIDASTDGVPTKAPFSPSEIETINSNGNAFKSGSLRFEDFEETENYEALRIVDWKNILKNEDIKEIILTPTFDGLKKLVEIKSSAVFERVRGIYTALKNDESNDISNRIDRIINTRYQELANGKIKTEIVLTQKDSEKKAEIDNSAIQAENAELRNELSDLKAMMAELLANKKADAVEATDPKSTVEDGKKSAGRPAKAK